METKIVNLKVVVTGDTNVKQLEKDINKVVVANNKLEATTKKSGKATSDALGGAQEAADNLGGGLSGVVEQFKVVTVASKKGGKAMRSAMISTGVGALIVALGLIVDNWEEILLFTGLVNKDLEKQQSLIEDNLDTLGFELKLLETKEKILKAEGKSTTAIKEEKKKIIILQQEQNTLLLENLRIQLEREKAQVQEITLWEKIKVGVLGASGAYKQAAIEAGKSVAGNDEEKERLKELEKLLQNAQLRAENLKLSLLTVDDPGSNTKRKKETETTLDGITGEDRAREIEQRQKHFEDLFEIEKMNKDAMSELGKDALNEALHNEDVLAAVQEENRRKTLVQTKILRAQEVQYAKEGLDAISTVLGQSSAAGKAVAISSALINTYQGISAELATKTATPFEFGLKIANIASVVSIGFKAVKDIVATKLPNFANSGGSGGGGGGGQSAPSFNVVGNSGASQIAQTLNQEQQPIEAYVVASNVTSAQEVNRNIIENATIG